MQPDLIAREPSVDDATSAALLRKKWFVPGAQSATKGPAVFGNIVRNDHPGYGVHVQAEDDTPYADDYEAALAKEADEKRGPMEMLAYALVVVGCIAAWAVLW